MVPAFDFQLRTRIVWHSPVAESLPRAVAALGAGRVLVVTDPGLVATGLPDTITDALAGTGVSVEVHPEVGPDPSIRDVAAARSAAVEVAADVIIGFGGGSVIDTAKAAAMLIANGGEYTDYKWGGRPIVHRSHPLVAVPTTAGTGSEVSRVAVISDPDQAFKKGVLSPEMFAHTALLDPMLTVDLPAPLTAATGVDAFVHALEAFTGRRTNPISDALALEAMRLVVEHLRRATADGRDPRARSGMMLAAARGGMAMDQAGLGLVHALSGGLCSHTHLHHGLANAMLLPGVVAFNADAIEPARRRRLHEVLGLAPDSTAGELVEMITNLVRALDLPVGLGELRPHLGDADRQRVVEESMRMVMVGNNPRAVSAQECRTLLDEMCDRGP
ncbi:MAG: iron-containing alcohol dehydrogenase family protein [Acidimicrobiales bacterium]